MRNKRLRQLIENKERKDKECEIADEEGRIMQEKIDRANKYHEWMDKKKLVHCHTCRRRKSLFRVDWATSIYWNSAARNEFEGLWFSSAHWLFTCGNSRFVPTCKSCREKIEKRYLEREAIREKRRINNEIQKKKWEKWERDHLTNRYVKARLRQQKVPIELIEQYPILIELKRAEVKTKRFFKNK